MTPLPNRDAGPPGGDGAFETLRWVRGKVPRLEAHQKRLAATLESRGLPAPDWSAVLGSIEAQARGLGEARVRVGVPFGGPQPGRWSCEVSPLPDTFGARRQGIAAVSCVVPAAHWNAPPAEKLFSRRDVLQRMAAALAPAECLLVDPAGRVLEGATWNLFALVDGRLHTPAPGPEVLAGTVREAVLSAVAAWDLECRVGALPVDALWRASEVFVTNALLPLAPLCSLNGRKLPAPGPCLRALLEVVDAVEVA